MKKLTINPNTEISEFDEESIILNIDNGEFFSLNQTATYIFKEISKKITVENLKKAQRIWIEFRDAELEMKYPKRERGYYGSIQPLCKAIYLKKLTDKRTETLKVWLIGIEEGDACNGSVKTN